MTLKQKAACIPDNTISVRIVAHTELREQGAAPVAGVHMAIFSIKRPSDLAQVGNQSVVLSLAATARMARASDPASTELCIGITDRLGQPAKTQSRQETTEGLFQLPVNSRVCVSRRALTFGFTILLAQRRNRGISLT
jgi:hypothetical protein